VLDDARAIGLTYIGTAGSPGQRYGETVEGYKRAAQDFNASGRKPASAACASTSTTTRASSPSRTARACTT
jgi:hypothetical protein